MKMKFGPVLSRTTIQDSVYQQLRQALMNAQFDPDQTLTIASLAETFGTSNMPVREALRRLAAENALEISSGGSARVPVVTKARLDDLCRARVTLEAMATELAVPLLTQDDLATLQNIVSEQQTIGREKDVYTLIGKNQEFHFTIYRASGSEVLIQLIETLWLRFGPYMRVLSTHSAPLIKAGVAEPSGHHQTILQALRDRDAARAKAAMIADIEATQEVLRTLCPE